MSFSVTVGIIVIALILVLALTGAIQFAVDMDFAVGGAK